MRRSPHERAAISYSAEDSARHADKTVAEKGSFVENA